MKATKITGLSAVGKIVHPYPTQAEAIKRLADQYEKTKLSPFIRKILHAWLKWQRR